MEFEGKSLEECLKKASLYFKEDINNLGYTILEKKDSPEDRFYDRSYYKIKAFVKDQTHQKLDKILKNIEDDLEEVGDLHIAKKKKIIENFFKSTNDTSEDKQTTAASKKTTDISEFQLILESETSYFLQKDGKKILQLNFDPNFVTLTAYKNEPTSIPLNILQDTLQQLKIKEGINKDNLIKLANSEDKIEIVLAMGIPPHDGKDARLEFNPKVWNNPDIYIDEHGRVDYKKISFIKKVKKGDWIIAKYPPTPHTDGKNLFGEIVKAKKGRDITIIAGKNITPTMGTQKETIYYSTKDGHVIFDGINLDVEDAIVISGDVDYSTGNIDYEGLVIIEGNILDEFVVKAKKGIQVKGNIYKATVASQKMIIVRKGIIGGEVESETKVHANFIESAKIICGEDVIAETEIIHSEIFAGGNVVCTGNPGKIIGGKIVAFSGVTCREVGSPYGVKTYFELGTHFFSLIFSKKLLDKIKTLKEKLSKLTLIKQRVEKLLTNAKENNEAISEDTKERLAKLTLNEITIKKQLILYMKKLKEVNQNKKLNLQAYLFVRGTAHPPLIVDIVGKKQEFHEPLKYPKIRYSIGKKQLIVE